MYYPEEVIEEVRTRNDIVDIVSQYVNLKKKGANYFCLPIEADVLLFWLRSRRKRDLLRDGI